MAKSFRISSSFTLGCRFLQDEEKGDEAGIVVAAVEKDGAAERAGIVVGMLIDGIHGERVPGMPFDQVMGKVREARGNNDTWSIELIHPMYLPAEISVRWASLLQENGLNEWDKKRKGEGGAIGGGFRRLSVAVGLKSGDAGGAPVVPIKLMTGIEQDSGGRRGSVVSDTGSDGYGPSSGRRASITQMSADGATPPAPGSARRGSVASDGSGGGMPPGPQGRRGSVSMSSDTPPAGSQGRRGSVSMAAPQPGSQGRRGSVSVSSDGGTPPADQPNPMSGRRQSISQGPPSGLSTIEDPKVVVPRFEQGHTSIGKYKVLAKCTVREGKEGESIKVGEYPKGTVLDVREESTSKAGLAVVHASTRTASGAMGGWVKVKTAKGKLLIEKQQGVRSGRRMSVQTITPMGEVIEPEELIDVTFSGSGALGMLFEEIPSERNQGSLDITVKKIVPDSIAADIRDVEVALILRSINSSEIAGLAYADTMKLIGTEWRGSDEMTLTFARPEIVEDSEKEEDEQIVQLDYMASPGGRIWVDGADVEKKSHDRNAGIEQHNSNDLDPLELQEEEEEEDNESAQECMAEESPRSRSDSPTPPPRGGPGAAARAQLSAPAPAPAPAFVAPPKVFAFMEENGAGEYAAKLCETLGVERVEDFLDLEDADYTALEMKTIPKRRLLKAVVAMRAAAAAPEEAVPPAPAPAPAPAPVAVPEALAEAPAPKPEKPPVNVYISPFLDQPETNVEMERIRERMGNLIGQSGRLKCMRTDYTGWDVVETFDA